MYRVAYYFTRAFSSGLDDYSDHDDEKGAVKEARKRVRDGEMGAHALIHNERGMVVATVVTSRGRVYLKRAKAYR